MQKRNFKDAMREMSEHVVTKIRDYTEELIHLNRGDDDRLRMGSIGMDMDHPRTILYVILHKLIQDDFKPRNDTYKHVMDEIFKQLKIDEQSRPKEKKSQGPAKGRFKEKKKQEQDPTRT
tara:strand:- start:343 stop:702 length:360 start_codon:yes stop_codon:yes gene_type:complete